MDRVICSVCGREMELCTGVSITDHHKESEMDSESSYAIYGCICGNTQYCNKENIKVLQEES